MIQMRTAPRERTTAAGETAATSRNLRVVPVTPDIACVQNLMVNLYFVGQPRTGSDWVLIDTGMPHSAERILRCAEQRFGARTRPRAIFLTHGHFDHVGGVSDLAEHWDVPVFAHELELPYLTGLCAYPPPDPNVGGGLLAWISGLYPRSPISLGHRVHPLQSDTLPFIEDWTWVHTPGHTPGHVSFFRPHDRVLLAGDAFVTTRQESLISVLTQRRGVFGPPAYFTSDWASAWASVQRLASLHPAVAATGHGLPMQGDELADGLQRLARDFDRLAVPHRGRYVLQPAVSDRTGVVYVPPAPVNPLVVGAVGLAGAASAIAIYYAIRRRRKAAATAQPAEPVIRTPATSAADRADAV